MKKLIAISVVFALAAGVAFALDVGGTVFGHVDVISTDFNGGDVNATGGMDRIRIDGAGEAGDGKFGGYIRLQVGGDDYVSSFANAALAWWKPIDQLKLTIGKNGDAIWGKEGVTGWMFNQMPYDSGIALGSSNIWGWGETVAGSLQTRFAFFHGYDDWRAALEIKPFDVLGINIAIPFIEGGGGSAEDVFKATIAQVDLNFSFGNIALTFNGKSHFGDPAIFLYYGGSFGDFGLDFGVAYHISDGANHPIFLGLGAKFATGSFGIKFRTALGIPLEANEDFNVLFDLLPYIAINDNISVFFNMGLGLSAPSSGDAAVGWFVNPYLRVGAEWGPTFYVGIKLEAEPAVSDPTITFSIPVSLMVSF